MILTRLVGVAAHGIQIDTDIGRQVLLVYDQQIGSGNRGALVDEVRQVWKVSVRKACSALRVDRSLYINKSKCGDQAAGKHLITEICETRERALVHEL